MATTHWRKGYSVTQLYQQPDANWSFHQLARLLLGMGVQEDSILETLSRRVNFIGSMSRSLPAGEIRAVTVENYQHKIECTHYNLTGLDGPLAEPFSDMMREDIHRGKGAMSAFINIFNNRIHCLRYLVHAQTNCTLSNDKASATSLGQFLLALSGHYYATQRALHGQEDDTLLSLSGHLANCRMTFPTIRKLFDTVLALPVIAMNSLIGRWLPIQKADHIRLGVANHHLGNEATLGTKIWDQQAVFELVLGPVTHKELQDLVPGGREHDKLHKLVAWVSEKRIDCQITIICDADDVEKNNATVLSQTLGTTNRLGYGAALLGTTKRAKQVRFMLDMVD